MFGVASGLSISKLFLAGIFPGLMLGVSLAVAWWWVVRKETLITPPKTSGKERWRAFIDSLWALGLPFIIIFGLKFGIFTPTEAGVVAAVYSLFVATVVYRELKLSDLYPVFLTSAKVTAVVMFLVAASLVSAWLITIADLPGQVTELLEPLMDSQTLLLVAIMVLVVIVGTAMDMTPTILILTPVLVPVVKEAGHRPDLLRRAVHHQQRDRPDHAAGRHRAQRRGRRVADQHGGPDEGRLAVHARRADRPGPAGPVPGARPRPAGLAEMSDASRAEPSIATDTPRGEPPCNDVPSACWPACC